MLSQEKSSAKSWLERQELLQDEPSDSPFFTVEKQQGVTSIMLDFDFENGNRLALPYSGVMKIDFNPSDGIVLEWGNEHIRVIGQNLGELYALLARHKVSAIRESREAFRVEGEGELFIREIARETKQW